MRGQQVAAIYIGTETQCKRIFKAAGLKRMVTVVNPTSREEEKRVLYEIASSHLARRTFVGNLYKQVKDPNLVGSLSGHNFIGVLIVCNDFITNNVVTNKIITYICD